MSRAAEVDRLAPGARAAEKEAAPRLGVGAGRGWPSSRRSRTLRGYVTPAATLVRPGALSVCAGAAVRSGHAREAASMAEEAVPADTDPLLHEDPDCPAAFRPDGEDSENCARIKKILATPAGEGLDAALKVRRAPTFSATPCQRRPPQHSPRPPLTPPGGLRRRAPTSCRPWMVGPIWSP